MLALFLYLQGELVPNKWSVWIVLIQSIAAVVTAIGVPWLAYRQIQAQQQGKRIEKLANGNLTRAQTAEAALRQKLDAAGLDHTDVP